MHIKKTRDKKTKNVFTAAKRFRVNETVDDNVNDELEGGKFSTPRGNIT